MRGRKKTKKKKAKRKLFPLLAPKEGGSQVRDLIFCSRLSAQAVWSIISCVNNARAKIYFTAKRHLA